MFTFLFFVAIDIFNGSATNFCVGGFYISASVFILEKFETNPIKNTFSISFIETEESIGFVKTFDFQFLLNLYVLGCADHDLTISGKCLRVVCVTKILRQVLPHRIS